jgi:hypothetical protein
MTYTRAAMPSGPSLSARNLKRMIDLDAIARFVLGWDLDLQA